MKNTIKLLLLVLFVQLKAQNTYVPDDNFEQALIDLGYDSSPLDDYVPTANINTVTYLNLDNKSISDLTGIEDFTALAELHCSDNQLQSINITQNAALTKLICLNNQLTSINLTQNTALEVFYCSHNQLTNLDLSNNLALKNLNCDNNMLQTLDLSQNTELISLNCHINQLQSLDLSQNTSLIQLFCFSNLLESLNVKNGNNTNFIFFNTQNNPNLTCIIVDDASWSAANWTSIDSGSTFVNNQAECDALNVDDNYLKEAIKLYPNPVKDSLTISNNENIVINKVTIYNLLGKEVYQTNSIENSIDTGNLKSGIYLVKLKCKTKLVIKKIIINR